MSPNQRAWEEFLTIDGAPIDQSQSEMVILFAQGDPMGSVFWQKSLDRLVCIPKNETTVTRPISDFVSLCVHTVAPDTVGFQLGSFSHVAPSIWELLGQEKDGRVSLDAILLYYWGIVLGASARDPKADIDFELDKMRELRELFGHITILQPEHARTIAL